MTASVLPHDLDAEQAVLGCLLIDPEAITRVRDILRPGDFSTDRHELIYRAATELAERSTAVDLLTLKGRLTDSGNLDRVGGVEYLAELVAKIPTAVSAPHYAQRVADFGERRRLVKAAEHLAQSARNGQWNRDSDLAAMESVITASRHREITETSWTPVDLERLLAGQRVSTIPTILGFDLFDCLLYPRRTHSFVGESESLKTWAALVAVVQELSAGHHVAYIDFEDTAESVVADRLHHALRVSPEKLVQNLTYIRPYEPLLGPGPRADLLRAARLQPSLVVVDGLTEGMALNGLNPDKGAEVARYHQIISRPFTEQGAAVLHIDHTNRTPDSRNATGSPHKLNVLDGASLRFESIARARRGGKGAAKLLIAKDRPGALRAMAHGGRHIATFTLDSSDDGVVGWSFERPGTGGDADTPHEVPAEFRPTTLMKRISDLLARQSEPISQFLVLQVVTGKRVGKLEAIQCLIREGYVAATEGPRRTLNLTLVRPFEGVPL